MEKTCPNHIKRFVKPLNDGSKYNIKNFNKLGDYAFAYEVKCLCSCENFKVYKDEHPTVIVECSSCGANITVYDLKYYPAAIKLNQNFKLEKYESEYGDELFNICVIYEYSDEFEFKDDVEFDRNDISWCSVYGHGLKSHVVYEIINDETT